MKYAGVFFADHFPDSVRYRNDERGGVTDDSGYYHVAALYGDSLQVERNGYATIRVVVKEGQQQTLYFFLRKRDTIFDGTKYHFDFDADSSVSVWIQILGTDLFEGKYLETYPGGKIKCSGVYSKGNRVGLWNEYYANGNPRAHGNFKKGEMDGLWKFYYESGKEYSEGYNEEGYKVGLWKTYYENGQLLSQGQYFMHMNSGTWRWYYENTSPNDSVGRGKLKAQAHYIIKSDWQKTKLGIGSNKYWDPKYHLPWMKRTWKSSPVDSLVEYYPDGKLRSRIIYDKHGNEEGSAEYYYPDARPNDSLGRGKLNRIEFYKNGKPVDCWKYYCEDGSLSRFQNMNNQQNACDLNQEVNEDCTYPGDILPEIPTVSCWPPLRIIF